MAVQPGKASAPVLVYVNVFVNLLRETNILGPSLLYFPSDSFALIFKEEICLLFFYLKFRLFVYSDRRFILEIEVVTMFLSTTYIYWQ